MKILRTPGFIILGLLAAANVMGAVPEPTLGKKGKLLLEENFEAAALPKGWARNTGTLTVADGVLHASQLAKDNHIAAFRKALPLQDCAIQLDFKFAGATTFNLGFDPAPGELKKKGHLFSVVITPTGWTLTEHNDKADPNSKAKPHAKAAAKFAQGEWFTMLLEVKGDNVVVRVDGKEPLRATAKDFHVKKPGLVFRVGGKDGQEMLVDNVKVWALE